ncbi:hypothetical protein ACX80W_01235 [Arthrobacter sp. TMN-37]
MSLPHLFELITEEFRDLGGLVVLAGEALVVLGDGRATGIVTGTGDRGPGTGDRGPGTGDRGPGTGDLRR